MIYTRKVPQNKSMDMYRRCPKFETPAAINRLQACAYAPFLEEYEYTTRKEGCSEFMVLDIAPVIYHS
jgi:hypothetical protein